MRTDKFTTFLDVTPEVLKFVKDIIAEDKLRALQMVTFKVGRDIEYRSDTEGYGIPEKFAPPWQTLANGFGDCEDVAVLICTSMNGLPEQLRPEKIRWTVGRYSKLPIPRPVIPIIGVPIPSPVPMFPWEIYHSWAEVLIDGVWWIAEGTSGDVFYGTDPRYTPLFSINTHGMEIHAGGW